MICVLILACNRPDALHEALTTWSEVAYPITVSMDSMHMKTYEVAKQWQKKMPNLEVVMSFQAYLTETGEQAKKTDERITRHWISAITRLFYQKNCEYVVYAEDDHVIGKNFEMSLQTLIPALNGCTECFSANMGCHGNCWGMRSMFPHDVARMETGNVGGVYWKRHFIQFLEHIDIFCDILGTWDVNLNIMQIMQAIPPYSLTYLLPRIHHLSTCYSSRTKRTLNRECDWQKETEKLQDETLSLNFYLNDLGIAKPMEYRPMNYPKADNLTRQRCITAAKYYQNPPW